MKRLTYEELKLKTQELYQGKLRLGEFEYTNSKTLVPIICNCCGEVMLRTPNQTLRGILCSGCERMYREAFRLGAKYCRVCKKPKSPEEFYSIWKNSQKRMTICIGCLNRIKSEKIAARLSLKIPMFVSHKLCTRCGRCLEVSKFRNHSGRCRECLAEITKEFRNRDPERFKEYRENRKPISKRYAREYLDTPAMFDNTSRELVLEDGRKNVDGKLFVECKLCGREFQPTRGQVKSRVVGIKKHSGNNFYCSDGCKKACPVFGAKPFDPKYNSDDARSLRSKQRKSKRRIEKEQCNRDGYVSCERCGEIYSVDIHHTYPVVSDNPSDDDDSMILLCYKCHLEVHSQCR